jgi:hypothetical protein
LFLWQAVHFFRTRSLVTGIPVAPRAGPANAAADMNARATIKHNLIFLRITILLVRWDDRGNKCRFGARAAIPVPSGLDRFFLRAGTMQHADYEQ